jgi:hypothetical protein
VAWFVERAVAGDVPAAQLPGVEVGPGREVTVAVEDDRDGAGADVPVGVGPLARGGDGDGVADA